MGNPVIDLIIRIKNAYQSRHSTIEVPYSIFKEQVVKKLQQIGYLKGYQVSGEIIKKMTLELSYTDSEPALTGVKIFSKPGRRWYVSSHELKPILGGLGYSLLSTSRGILTNVEAKKQKVGGELLFSIW